MADWRRRRYLFDSKTWQATQNITNRAGLPENPKVNNAGHPKNYKNSWMLIDFRKNKHTKKQFKDKYAQEPHVILN